LVNWNKVTTSKHLGGLGIRTARETNTSLLGKLVWDMVQSSNKLWVHLLSNKYIRGRNFLQLSLQANNSPSWSSIIRANNILNHGYSWHAGSCSSSFWFNNWSTRSPIGNHVPVIEIHDLHLTVKDVLSVDGFHAHDLYTNLPNEIIDFMNSTHFRFNAAIEDSFIWAKNKNGNYTTKSGYDWLLSLKATVDVTTPHRSWSWIWRLQAPWLFCHNAVPTMSLLHHRNMASAATCSRCGEEDETLMHCFRDCRFSKTIWLNIGFSDTHFFSDQDAPSWIHVAATGSRNSCFLAALWWIWRQHNLMCLNNETWSLFRITNNIHNYTGDIIKSLQQSERIVQPERLVKWNCQNHFGAILNVDGSCLGSPIRAGFGGIIRNSHGFYLSGFSGHISISNDSHLAELTAIYHGLHLAIDMGLDDLACYSDSLLSITLITVETPKFHIYAALLQDIKDLLGNRNFTLYHTLREGN